jgi:CHAT domain-containing protein/tetratricopeptide (TPR) repeat protein
MATELETQRIRHCAEEVVLAARSDPALAGQLVREIESIARNSPTPLFEAYSQRAQGHLLHIRGNVTEAVQRYRAAFTLFEECDEHVERARTASSLVGALVPLGEYGEALSLADQARRIFERTNLHIRAARLDVNVGNLYHKLNRLEDALIQYDRAAPIFENSDDREAAAGVLINRSVVLMLLYRFDEALQGFERARAYSEKHGLRVFATQSEYNRAYLLFLIGDYAQAMKLMQIAETGFQEIGDEVHIAHCRLDRAEILLELNLPEHASESATLAETGFQASGLKADRARALLVLGRCLVRQGRAIEAVTHYSTGRHLFEAEGNDIWASMANLEIAAALTSLDRADEASELTERASEVFRVQKHLPFSALADALSARLRIERGEAQRALWLLNRCESSLDSRPPAFLAYHIAYLKGRAFELEGKDREAFDSYTRAARSLEFLLTHISLDHVMGRFLEDKEDVFERLAALSSDVKQAARFADLARTRVLTAPRNLRTEPNKVSGRIRKLRETLRSDHLSLFKTDQPDSASFLTRIRQNEQRLMQELIDSEFRHGAPAPAPLEAGTFDVPAGEVVLEYFITDSAVWVFVIGDEALERIKLPISPAELEQEVRFARYGLSRPGDSRRQSALDHHLRRLYEVLIGPVKCRLGRRIVVIPHRFLYHLPFHAILGPDGYLAEEYIVSSAPSLASYALASGGRASRPAPSPCTSLIVGWAAPDLPAIESEAQAVARRLPNCTIAFDKSLEEIRPMLEAATFIHIASHGIFRSDNPSCSLLNLGSDVLTPADMLNLRINADLVTMSACSTGQTYVRGNEVQGFVRAFSQWGVPSLLASLWDVNDRATSMLMSRFYDRIQDSSDIADNLRRAMLDVKSEFAHPHYWAPFVLIGRQRLGRNCTDFPKSDT